VISAGEIGAQACTVKETEVCRQSSEIAKPVQRLFERTLNHASTMVSHNVPDHDEKMVPSGETVDDQEQIVTLNGHVTASPQKAVADVLIWDTISDEDHKRISEGEPDGMEAEKPVLRKAPDGGWGWVVVFGSFMIHVIADGVAYSFGIYVESFLDHFNASRSEVGFLGSLMLGVTWGTGESDRICVIYLALLMPVIVTTNQCSLKFFKVCVHIKFLVQYFATINLYVE